MPDWEKDSPTLELNLRRIIHSIADRASRRVAPDVEDARHWHLAMMTDLEPVDPSYVGAFRGEPGLEDVQVRIGGRYGVPASAVARELALFGSKLQDVLVEMDLILPADKQPDVDQLSAVLDICAWTHSEWVRIHPFANGNGRTARLWANSVVMRYGLPPFIRLRPRPGAGYGTAGERAMDGHWQATAIVFRELLAMFLASTPAP